MILGGISMKAVTALKTVSVLTILLLTGCTALSATKEKQDVLSIIENASQKTAELENGEYVFTFSNDVEQELITLQGEGTFIQLENEVIWSTKSKLGQLGSNIQTLLEEIQTKGKMYQRIGVVNEKNEYIEEHTVPEWHVVAEESALHPLYLEDLIKKDFLVSDIESIETYTEGDHTVYELTYTEDYRNSVMEKEIKEIEIELKKLSSGNTDDGYLSSLKKAIDTKKRTDYKSKKVLLKVNEENILVYSLVEDEFVKEVNGTNHSMSARKETSIVDYNKASIGIDTDFLSSKTLK